LNEALGRHLENKLPLRRTIPYDLLDPQAKGAREYPESFPKQLYGHWQDAREAVGRAFPPSENSIEIYPGAEKYINPEDFMMPLAAKATRLAKMGKAAAPKSWETPAEIFEPLHKRFRFTVDAAAEPHNAKLPRYWTKADDDALKQDWSGETVFLNPPYGGGIEKFILRKAKK